jgi:hypothetical protein
LAYLLADRLRIVIAVNVNLGLRQCVVLMRAPLFAIGQNIIEQPTNYASSPRLIPQVLIIALE